MNSTKPNRVIQLLLGRMAAVLIPAALWAGSLAGAEAVSRRSLELIAPEQVVVIGSTGGLFEAYVLVGADGHACGSVKLALRDGTLIELEPIYGVVERDRGEADGQPQTVGFNDVGVSLVLTPRGKTPTNPDDLVIATVRSSGEVGCDIWVFTGGTMSGGTEAVPFEAQMQRFCSGEACQPANLGQFDTSIRIHAPRQTVNPFDGGDPLDFSANVRVGRDHAAHGVVYAPFSDRGGVYRIFFGMVLPHAERDFQIFLVGVRPDTAGLPTTDDFLRAAIFPAEINPECQIWDLVNGESGAVQHAATIEAETDLRFPPSPQR